MTTSFVHLRLQSSYSLLQSALKIEQIVAIAKKYKMPAVALTDRNNLFAMLEFSLAASSAGIQPIHGVIMTIQEDSDKGEILFFAKNQTGYSNLLKLVSSIYTHADHRHDHYINFAELAKYQDGLIALSGYTEGIIGKALLDKRPEDAIRYASKLQNLFGDRFYFEIMRHGLSSEEDIEAEYVKLASNLSIPLVATNNVLFADIGMHEAHDVLLCIAAGLTREHTDRKMVSNQCYLKSTQEMRELFHDIPEALQNSVYIAQRCSVMAEGLSPMLPKFAIDISEEEMLRHQATEGLQQKLKTKFLHGIFTDAEKTKITKQYMDRLSYELDVICKMDFSGYFLIVSDLIKWSKEHGISVGPGRGSGAGSIVAWSLLITDPDPIRFGLLFERFLNPERISMPDFDIDFCQERRGEVIEYVRQKYGYERVGQIITFGKMQAKAVIKDVARVLGLGYGYADYLTELVPFNAVTPVTLEQALHDVAELKQAYEGKGLYNMSGEEELIKQVLDTALILEGLHRHVSVHAAGIVIGGKDLVELLPLYRAPDDDMLIIQYSMKYAEIAGLVKFDFLGLQTLTVIAKCCSMLKAKGIEIDLPNLPLDDPKTYELLSHGEGAGVFQFESVGMRDTLRRMRPDRIEDLIALGALYRPGPMDNIPTYISCKHNKERPNYLHPALKTTLEETYGVIIYQEQVLEIAKVLAGYSLGAADLLRRAMGKKIKSEMEAQEKLFIDGAENNKIDSEQAKSIFTTVAKFAGYGFNKAHATAYAMISYQTAYLKANYTAEFLVACLNLDINDSDKINLFIQEARQYNIEIVFPDINQSSGLFTLHDDKIIFALGAIKGLTVAAGDAIAQESKAGKFENIIEFVERMAHKIVNKKLLENLIKAGGFDSIHSNRNQLLLSIPKLLAHANLHHAEKTSKQYSLMQLPSDHILTEIDDLSLEDKAFAEFDVLGMFLSYHPLTAYAEILKQNNIVNSFYIKNELQEKSSHIKIAGIIQNKDSRMSARGRFVTLQLSDQYGNIEITIFSEEILKQYVHLLDIKSLVVISCDVFKDEGGFRLTATKLESLDDILNSLSYNLTLQINNGEELNELLHTLSISKESDNKPNAYIELLIKVEDIFIAKVNVPPLYLPLDVIHQLNIVK